MIKKSFNAAVLEALTKSNYFTQHDFVVATEPRRDRGVILTISYKYDPRFQLTATLPRHLSDGTNIAIAATPGSVTETERGSCYGRDELFGRIAEWADDLRAELKAIPLAREFEVEREKLDSLIAELKDLPDEYFTRDEADELKARLDELEKKFIDHVRTSTEEVAAAKQKVEQLHREFDMLKTTVDVLKKPGWAATFMAKCGRWLRDPSNRALLKDGAGVARKLLE